MDTEKQLTQQMINDASKHSRRNRDTIIQGDSCACYYCLKTYNPDAIIVWIDRGKTALCPKCDVDAVLSNLHGYPFTKDALIQLHNKWFKIG